MPPVHLATPPGDPAADLRDACEKAGFAVADVSLTAAELPGLGVVVVVAGEPVGPAVAFVRRVRQTSDSPTLWVSTPESAAVGLDAGAVAALARSAPADVIAAQVRALARAADHLADLSARAEEARTRNAELQAAYDDIDRGIELARRVHRLLLPARLPEVGPVRVAVHHRPRARTGTVLYDAARLGDHHVGFWVASVGGSAATGGLLGVVVKHAAAAAEARSNGGRPVSPAEVLDRVNRALLELTLDPPPLAGMTYALIDVRTGAVAVSRGGLPPPVRVPAEGPAEAWVGPGPFLGAFDADFPAHATTLRPGERLILRTGTPAADADPLPPAAVRHRLLRGAAYPEAVAKDMALLAADEDELTLLVAEVME